MNGKSLVSLILIVVGALLLLKMAGALLGGLAWLVQILMPFILIGLGYLGMRNNRTFIGGILIAIGALMLLARLTPLLMLLGAIALIVFGIAMFRKNQNRRY